MLTITEIERDHCPEAIRCRVDEDCNLSVFKIEIPGYKANSRLPEIDALKGDVVKIYTASGKQESNREYNAKIDKNIVSVYLDSVSNIDAGIKVEDVKILPF